MKRKALLLSLVIVCLIFSLCPATPLFGIRFNVSPSLPNKLFISTPCHSPQRNQYVSIDHPPGKMPLAKKIIGIPGDTICVQNQHIYVNDQDYGLVLERSKSGMVLTPISVKEVPEGHIFAYAPHAESFDSRYQEFGLVKIEQIKEQLCPIF